ncbi:glycerol-3-phosphate 1-O-acyltransferase PlsY [Photobacterium japonica]|uniref:glycerol-3-phosphate 1-O-acyltransferase PlsY n=1 Tax=Photobacterium japonica TaxID=2910235 RepID=UPI003D0EACF1
MTPFVLLIIISAYLLGSISSAVLISRLYGLPDPRESGSGNPGATNVLRLGGRGAAAAVLICDILKGMLPVWLSYLIGVNPFMLGIIGIAACLGHIYPIFFHFRGGKGVATALGALAPIGWDLSGMLIGAWLLTVLVSGYSSVGAITTALFAPLFTWWVKPEYTMPVAMLSCLLVFRHHDNLRRLLAGEEPRIWQKFARKNKTTPPQE